MKEISKYYKINTVKINHHHKEDLVQNNKFLVMKKSAFTLTEILVTISVLGVIAAILIPSIINKIKDRIAITRVKMAYSILDNAINQAISYEGKEIYQWDWPSRNAKGQIDGYNANNYIFFARKIAEQLPVTQNCINYDDILSCHHPRIIKEYSTRYKVNAYYALDGKTYYSYGPSYGNPRSIVLKNNMLVTFEPRVPGNKELGMGLIRVDIDGDLKGPNRNGYDIFWFMFDDKGMVINPYSKKNQSGVDYVYMNRARCSNPNRDDAAAPCAYYILRHNSMNYKYRDVGENW